MKIKFDLSSKYGSLSRGFEKAVVNVVHCSVLTQLTALINVYLSLSLSLSFDHAKLQLELEIMSVLSINYQVCLAHEILLLNSSAFLMTTFHYELHYKGRFEEKYEEFKHFHVCICVTELVLEYFPFD